MPSALIGKNVDFVRDFFNLICEKNLANESKLKQLQFETDRLFRKYPQTLKMKFFISGFVDTLVNAKEFYIESGELLDYVGSPAPNSEVTDELFSSLKDDKYYVNQIEIVDDIILDFLAAFEDVDMNQTLSRRVFNEFEDSKVWFIFKEYLKDSGNFQELAKKYLSVHTGIPSEELLDILSEMRELSKDMVEVINSIRKFVC